MCSSDLAVLSTGEVIPNPKHLELVLPELRCPQRQAARRTGPDKLTRRWRRTQARIARLHTRVANARRDGLHQLTTRLARTFGTIVLEDLAVSGMLRNRRLARRWIVISTPPVTWPRSRPWPLVARPPRVAGRRETSPLETHVRPTTVFHSLTLQVTALAWAL